MRKVDHRLAERRIDLVGAAVGDEAAVELELLEGQLLDLGERRIGAAEIVDRQAHVVRLQFLAQFGSERQVGDDLSSGMSMIRPGHLSLVRVVRLDDVFDRKLDQRRHRNIDREPQIDAELGKCAPVLSALSSASSDNLRVAASEALAVNAPASTSPCCGWRTRA